jgi:hypothetical protein
MKLGQWLRRNCSRATVQRLRSATSIADRAFLSWWLAGDLNRLATIFGTDKWGDHWYTQHYERYFRSIRSKRINLLEIGVGGHEPPSEGGRSLRMWKAYFHRSRIVGIDIEDLTYLRERRIDIRQCDQTDATALKRLSEEYGGFDIVIDDGSHVNEHVIKTFEILFPLLRPDGFYAIEDTQTACWPTWGGGRKSSSSSIGYIKDFIDGLNYAEYPIPGYKPTYFDENIVEIAFFHNLLVVRKGKNDEGTNCRDFIEHELSSQQAGVADGAGGAP